MIRTLWHSALTAAKYSALLICALCVLIILFFFSRLPNALDPQGEARGDNCIVEELPPISNGAGMIATGHVTLCDNIVHDVATYIYVHRLGKEDSRRSLVFRFGNENDGTDDDVPKITWVGRSTLHISVGHVSEVSKQIDSLDGVKISYSIGKEDFPREYSDRYDKETIHIAEVMFVLLLVLIYVCVIFARSILKQHRASDGDSVGVN